MTEAAGKPDPAGADMRILAVEGATPHCSVAVCSAARHGTRPEVSVLAEITADLNRAHAEQLLSMVDEALGRAGMGAERVDYLAVTVGPGSFTGLRIALAAWKGLAFAWNRPLVGVSTLRALAWQCPFPGAFVAPMLDARMGEVFAAVYKMGRGGFAETVLAEQAISPAALAKHLDELKGTVLALGDGAWRYGDILRDGAPRVEILPRPFGTPRASMVALEAVARMPHLTPDQYDPSQVNPVYLRVSQAEMARASGLEQAHGGTC